MNTGPETVLAAGLGWNEKREVWQALVTRQSESISSKRLPAAEPNPETHKPVRHAVITGCSAPQLELRANYLFHRGTGSLFHYHEFVTAAHFNVSGGEIRLTMFTHPSLIALKQNTQDALRQNDFWSERKLILRRISTALNLHSYYFKEVTFAFYYFFKYCFSFKKCSAFLYSFLLPAHGWMTHFCVFILCESFSTIRIGYLRLRTERGKKHLTHK